MANNLSIETNKMGAGWIFSPLHDANYLHPQTESERVVVGLLAGGMSIRQIIAGKIAPTTFTADGQPIDPIEAVYGPRGTTEERT